MQNKLRQFSAVASIDHISLKNEILCPSLHDSNFSKKNWKNVSKRLRKKFKRELNLSQYKSIKTAMQTNGISILQGPPGTGKTKTVISLINLLHIAAYSKYYESLLNWIKSEHSDNNKKVKQNFGGITSLQNINLNTIITAACSKTVRESDIRRKKPRILVCAPSNSAVDEIVSRLAVQQMFDFEEKLYTPRMIRLKILKSKI
ncbi:hypothetical protein MHBO_003726, partial [Bonamia ostreae]